MARPLLNSIAPGLAAWDADVDQNFSLLTESPLPVYVEDTVGELPTASSYEDCIALVSSDYGIYVSDGVSWENIIPVSDNQANSTATDVAGLVSDINTLLANLIAAGIMASS